MEREESKWEEEESRPRAVSQGKEIDVDPTKFEDKHHSPISHYASYCSILWAICVDTLAPGYPSYYTIPENPTTTTRRSAFLEYQLTPATIVDQYSAYPSFEWQTTIGKRQ